MDRPKLSFVQIKRDVSVLDVARRYGVALKPPNKKGWMSGGRCPLPSHSSKESKTSFSVNPNQNYWRCWSNSCASERNGKQAGDVITFVALMERCEPYDAAAKLSDWYHLNGSAPQKQNSPPKAESPVNGGAVTQSNPTATATENKPLAFGGFKNIDATHGYLEGRGIKVATAEHFGVGYFAGRSSVIKDPYRIVLPVHNAKGELVAYVGRSLDPAEKDKYHFPFGFLKTLELFNLHRATGNTVLLVEGFFSVLWLWQLGFPNVVALMGRTMSDEQLLLLQRFKNVIVMLDGDVPGREATEKIVPKLAERCFVRTVVLPDGHQPDTLDVKEMSDLLRPLFTE